MQKDAQQLLETINQQSRSSNYGELARSLLRLKNSGWIGGVSPGARDAVMRRIIEGLVHYAHQLQDRLNKLDFSLKCSDNVPIAQEIVEKIESLSSLGRSDPELGK
ncbi:unnamed protein product [Didymodactylos carnosus]|uniref:Uncharacterized protein n=1 Tax=Didymodactylos carnosus TaxID=1234261 RepID=A0A8S2XPJ9_9BILA|nr:unnamed protein product [Didymodactylos carnosus]CAF4508859.1 unnamed protein product [Didymodactylos carnosus]